MYIYISLRQNIRGVRSESKFEIRTLSVIWTLTFYPPSLASIRCVNAITPLEHIFLLLFELLCIT